MPPRRRNIAGVVVEAASSALSFPVVAATLEMYLLVAFVLFSSGAAQKIILMEDFQPEKAEGRWNLIERTGAVYNDSLSCFSANVRHKDGVLYEITVNFKSVA